MPIVLTAVLLVGDAVTTSALTSYRFVNKMVDSSDGAYEYGYAPSIIYDAAGFHMLYCSSGTNGGLDDIRYVSSSDGRIWTAPKIVLYATDLTNERVTCDPSVVYYQAPDDSAPYYYLFYSGNQKDVQTVMFVARSQSIAGPYAKWTTRGTWEVGATDPQIIIGPAAAMPENSGRYGAGQQTVIVKDGQLMSWYKDDTLTSSAYALTFMTSTTNPTSWPPGTLTDVPGLSSVDVKYDEPNERYVMFYIANPHSTAAYLGRRFSTDGVTWTAEPEEVLCEVSCFPDWTHNVGISGDPQGQLIDGRALVVYGAPYDLDPTYDNDCSISPWPHCWGFWDLYGSAINPSGSVWNDIPWGWEWLGQRTSDVLALGDYDGDGKTDRAIVDPIAGNWYVICSGSGIGCDGAIPWGWHWLGEGPSHELALGEYDGDGKTDRAIVDPVAGRWYIIGSVPFQIY